MNMEIMLAFLIGMMAAAIIAGLTVMITLYVRNHAGRDDSGGTRGGKNGGKKSGGRETSSGEYTIKLSENRQGGQTWTHTLEREILIGRGDECDIYLSDKSVGRTQCKIVVGQHGLEVVDLGAKNRTKQNGVFVFSGSPLKRGDILKFGRATLIVESIQRLGREYPEEDDTEDVDEDEDERDRRNRQERERSRSVRHSNDTTPAAPWNEPGGSEHNDGDRGKDRNRSGNRSSSENDDTKGAGIWNRGYED